MAIVVSSLACTLCGKYAPSKLKRMIVDTGPRPNRPRWVEGWICSRCQARHHATGLVKWPEELVNAD